MFQVSLKDPENEIVITSDIKLRVDDPIIKELLGLLKTLTVNIDSGLKELSASRTNGTTNYSFETNDGRLWNQTISFDQFPDPNPKQTFNITDGFRLTEFEPHEAVRDLIIRLYNEINLKSITIEIL